MAESNASNGGQTHPLEAIDRDVVDRLLSREQPADQDIVDLARLLLRYEEFPGADGLRDDLTRAMGLWGLNRESLNSRARELWSSGFRPGQEREVAVGSGFDTDQSEAN
ncbi:hypothetical protein CWE17_06105 [Synechococcus sp. BS56D]|jgi:hypothetical protein|uniref:DUF3288 family protein n=1 Tax=Synechococcus sp. BS56D TaxID=2055944 RepID=UPI00103C03EC|nr:DUF3288 family protein [Synechococcus sp. BS56D]TCD58646.1 hypothetical protein CWE17_06105 [Synechococcus sp. BS56D]